MRVCDSRITVVIMVDTKLITTVAAVDNEIMKVQRKEGKKKLNLQG